MSFGGPGDHPRTDLLRHGLHPFPSAIEELLWAIFKIDPQFPYGDRPRDEQTAWEQQMWEWRSGRSIEQGCRALERALSDLKRAEST